MAKQPSELLPIRLSPLERNIFQVTGDPTDPSLVGVYTDEAKGDILRLGRTELFLFEEHRTIRYRDLIWVETRGTHQTVVPEERLLLLTLRTGETITVRGIDGRRNRQTPQPDLWWIAVRIRALAAEAKHLDAGYQVAWHMDVLPRDQQPQFTFDFDPRVTKMLPEVIGRGRDFGARIGPPLIELSATQTDKKKLSDAFKIIGFYCVSERFRRIVEEFESGVHQFFRIDLKTKKGEHYDAPYYILHACSIVDAFVLTRGHWSLNFLPRGEPNFGYRTWAASSREIGNHHLWTGGFMGGGVTNQMFISDALKRRLEAERIRYLGFSEIELLDMDWQPEEELPPELKTWLQADPKRVRDLMMTRPQWLKRCFPDLLN